MALIGVTLASMLSAVAYGTESGRDVRELIARGKMSTARLTAAIRESKRVIHADNGLLILWMRDADRDGEIDADEVRRLELNAATGIVTSITTRVFDEAEETAGDADALLASLTDTAAGFLLTGDPDANETTFIAGLGAWSNTLDEATPEASRLVSFRLTLVGGEDREDHIAIGSAMLRNPDEL
jgi:hypothetical protein